MTEKNSRNWKSDCSWCSYTRNKNKYIPLAFQNANRNVKTNHPLKDSKNKNKENIKWHHAAGTNLSALLTRITSKHSDLYCTY